MTMIQDPRENAISDGANGCDPEPSRFSRLFGDDIADVLNPASWTPGADALDTQARLEREVADAVDADRRLAADIRRRVFPRIEAVALAGEASGVHCAAPEQIDAITNGRLLTGEVEAADGISAIHETLALTFIQVGVCIVSYDGDQETWAQRMYRRDHRSLDNSSLEEMFDLLQRRGDAGDRLSRIAGRGIKAYAERMFLTENSDARWRMCRGLPAPVELLAGAGIYGPSESGMTYPLTQAGVSVLRELLLRHKRFIFVPNENADSILIAIGRALAPREYAIIDTIADQLERFEKTHYYEDSRRVALADFRRDVGDEVVRGVFRASAIAPPQIFYAHRDHAHIAALIALADSALQEQRGSPVLLDLAQAVCRATFGADSYAPQLTVAYTNADAPETMIDC